MIEDTLRRAAAAVPGGPPALAEIHARRRRRRARSSAVALVGVGVLAAGVMVVPALIGSAPAAAPPAPVAAPPSVPAQRLIVSSFGTVRSSDSSTIPDIEPDPALSNYGYPAGVTGLLGFGPAEVTPSGLVPIELGGIEVQGWVPLADGGVATLEQEQDLNPPCSVTHPLSLRVYSADGTLALSREIGVRCEETILVGASADEAFLLRVPQSGGGSLVAHRFADGAERTLAGLDGFDVNVLGTTVDLSTDASRLVATSPSCGIEALDVTTTAVTTLHLADVLDGCLQLNGLRLSPNGDRLAVTYESNDDGTAPKRGSTEPTDLTVAVIDLATHAVLLQEVIATAQTSVITVPVNPFTFTAGMAWTDDSALRAAFIHIPAEVNSRVVAASDALDVRTYSVP